VDFIIWVVIAARPNKLAQAIPPFIYWRRKNAQITTGGSLFVRTN
jgi:hypothetical protein